jgi:uncharacterized phage-associated protein
MVSLKKKIPSRNYNAARLSKKTHRKGSPWDLTPDRKVITDQLIFDTFKRGVEE